MSQEQFDGLTRTLGRATSRGQVLKGLAGGFAAAVAGALLGSPGAEAAQLHGCCVFFCPDKENFVHRCARSPDACFKPEDSCELINFYFVSKCSACGIIGAP
jgi:hypothetical protein